MTRLAALLLCVLLAWPARAAEITPSDVYTQALRIKAEMDLLADHLQIRGDKPAEPVRLLLQPRHAWQKTGLILLKINLFRGKLGLPRLTVGDVEPVLNLEPAMNYEQTQRILAEIFIIKRRLGIEAASALPPPATDKTPQDVFNLFNAISFQWDVLNRHEVDAVAIYAEVRRIHADIDALLRPARVQDGAHPPAKEPATTLEETLRASFDLMAEVQRLQRMAGIPVVDFTPFRKAAGVLPSDVLNMVGMVLAELQPLKARLGLNHAITPATTFQEEANLADVRQFLGYAMHKLKLVRTL
ncbi:MAG: hypothetical protein HQM03_12590 [Magnetococcales bacterium]|nr:hypothetical protein [Magnetococcales bacterium]